MIKILLIISLFGCKPAKKPVDPQQIDSGVKVKAELYKSLHTGWAAHKCDSLGFTSLCKLSGGCVDANIFDAEVDGMWYRSPDHQCFDTGESASDTSKDMITMLLPYLYQTGDKDALKRIRSYGNSHGWVFGRGPISRTYMTPPIVAMIQRMIDGTGELLGISEESRGFERNLDAITALSTAMVKGSMPDNIYLKIKGYAEDQPNNALFQAIKNRYDSGDQSQTIGILMNENLFPSDRLPSTLDRCEGYLWQRDEDNIDWKPCQPQVDHDGTDFLFAAWVAGQL